MGLQKKDIEMESNNNKGDDNRNKLQKATIPWEDLSIEEQDVILSLIKGNGVRKKSLECYQALTQKSSSSFDKTWAKLRPIWRQYRAALLEGVTNKLISLADGAVDVLEQGLNHEKYYWKFESSKEILNRVMLTPLEEAKLKKEEDEKAPKEINIQVLSMNGSTNKITSDTTNSVGLKVEI